MTWTCARIFFAIALVAASPAAQGSEPSPSEILLNPLRGIAKGDLKAFVDAPLFEASRHRPVVDAPIAMPIAIQMPIPDSPPPNVHLLGLVEGAEDVAVVRGLDNRTMMVSRGDKIEGWDVVVMPPNGLRLSKGSRVFDYTLFAASGGLGGPTAVDEHQK